VEGDAARGDRDPEEEEEEEEGGGAAATASSFLLALSSEQLRIYSERYSLIVIRRCV
jgi:hypothetical protein